MKEKRNLKLSDRTNPAGRDDGHSLLPTCGIRGAQSECGHTDAEGLDTYGKQEGYRAASVDCATLISRSSRSDWFRKGDASA
jgi:hypothetical protein